MSRTADQSSSFRANPVLMSHDSSEGETQGTGFYGFKDGCSALVGQQVPKEFRVLTKEGVPVQGTSVTIAGFRR